jgi:hypothetical protein
MTKTKHLSSTRLLRRAAAVILISGAVALAAYAQSSNSKATPKTKKFVATKEIIFDQATKTLRKPTAAETDAMIAEISAVTNRTTDGLTARTLSNGTKQINLQGRYGSVLLGRANADGTTETRCVTSMAEAAEFLGLAEVE